MAVRVSKSKIEAQGRGEHVSNGERKLPTEHTESRIDTKTYQAMLTRELLINHFQEDYCKSY